MPDSNASCAYFQHLGSSDVFIVTSLVVVYVNGM